MCSDVRDEAESQEWRAQTANACQKLVGETKKGCLQFLLHPKEELNHPADHCFERIPPRYRDKAVGYLSKRRALFEALHPRHQQIAVHLREYANMVSWSQVTCSKRTSRQSPPNMLQNMFSFEALLAVSLIMDELICTMVGSKPEVDIASADLLQVPDVAGELKMSRMERRRAFLKARKRNQRKSMASQSGGTKCQDSAPGGIKRKSAKRKRDDMSESSVDWDTDSDAPSNQQQDGRVQVTEVGTREESAEAGTTKQRSAEAGTSKQQSAEVGIMEQPRSTRLGTSSLKRVKYM